MGFRLPPRGMTLDDLERHVECLDFLAISGCDITL